MFITGLAYLTCRISRYSTSILAIYGKFIRSWENNQGTVRNGVVVSKSISQLIKVSNRQTSGLPKLTLHPLSHQENLL